MTSTTSRGRWMQVAVAETVIESNPNTRENRAGTTRRTSARAMVRFSSGV